MPDDYLDSLRPEDRAQMWRKTLDSPGSDRHFLVVEKAESGTLVGFVALGAADEPKGYGELYAINVDPDHWGSGAGRLLLTEGHTWFAQESYDTAVLWVLPANARARRFYEREGWVCEDLQRTQDVLGVEVLEVRYSLKLD
jgi:GNAT superfamily N-acetyltransferase